MFFSIKFSGVLLFGSFPEHNRVAGAGGGGTCSIFWDGYFLKDLQLDYKMLHQTSLNSEGLCQSTRIQISKSTRMNWDCAYWGGVSLLPCNLMAVAIVNLKMFRSIRKAMLIVYYPVHCTHIKKRKWILSATRTIPELWSKRIDVWSSRINWLEKKKHGTAVWVCAKYPLVCRKPARCTRNWISASEVLQINGIDPWLLQPTEVQWWTRLCLVCVLIRHLHALLCTPFKKLFKPTFFRIGRLFALALPLYWFLFQKEK